MQDQQPHQPMIWEREPCSSHPFALRDARQEAAAVAALGGPQRCACGQPGRYFEVSAEAIWRCQTCYQAYLVNMRKP